MACKVWNSITVMAHHIENDDSLFFVGATPWHGMGTELPQLATAKEAIEAANLGWTVSKVPDMPVQLSEDDRLKYGLNSGLINPSSDKFRTVRSDTGTTLGWVGAQYSVLDNAHAFDFFDAVTQDPHGPKYETAGSLWNGRKVWMLAKMPDMMEVVPGDEVAPYILLSNSHDGSSAIRIQFTPIRVVCQNTLNAALSGNGKSFKVRHSGDVLLKVSQAQDALGILRNTVAETLEVYKLLANTTPTKEQIKTVLTGLFPDTKTDRAKLQRERVLSLAEGGIGNGNARVRGTAWALYNGVTELVDHHNNAGSRRDDAKDMRLNSIGLGSGFDAKADALDLILKTCAV